MRNESRTGHCVWLSLRFLLHAGEVAASREDQLWAGQDVEDQLWAWQDAELEGRLEEEEVVAHN